MRARYTLLAAILAAHITAAYSTCNLGSVSVTGKVAKAGNLALDLGEADDPQHPTAWQGPLKITNETGLACTVSEDVAMIEQSLLLGASVVYVPTYSGSENHLYAVDLKSCRVLWKSPAYTGKIRYSGSTLQWGRHSSAINAQCRPQGTRDNRRL